MAKRAPVAEIGDEDYRIVRHTHDVDEAARLMQAKLREDNEGCPRYMASDGCQSVDDEKHCQHARNLGQARQVYARIVPALPGSYAEDMGWAFTYVESTIPGRGAFPAVVFR